MQLQANRLGEMLLEAGLIDQFQLESALSLQRNLGGRIGSALVKLGYLSEETIIEFLETQVKYARVSLEDFVIPEELLRLLSVERMREWLVVPIELRRTNNEKTLRVAMTDPTYMKLIEDLQFVTGCRILPVLAEEADILRAIEKNRPQPDPEPADELAGADPAGHNLVDFSDLDISPQDPRLDKLLELLKEKGVLSVIDLERIKFS